VSFGDDDARLVAELVRQFGAAELVESAELASDVAAVLELWQTGRMDSGLPLDIRGTAFQHRVWQALQRIPLGQTRTYKEVAIEVDAPNAVRAVGAACAANRVALVVPCHRVLRSDGELGGFRWGLPLKRRLIDGERQLAARVETNDGPLVTWNASSW
jgi:AraC family transcriptional regulator of adaptative response/methylated-DNA-[protein]-cysteine methyltransferase